MNSISIPKRTLGDTQRLFSRCVARLILKITSLGYECTLGDAYRDRRCFGMLGTWKGYGHRNSCHKLRLAVDLNLFRGGDYLMRTEDHREIGVWWEQLGVQEGIALRWGGRFTSPDGNHYSCEWQGYQ